MKASPRALLLGILLGGTVLTAVVLLALEVPLEGFLLLLFAASLLWFLLPFVVLWLWRRRRRGRQGK